MCIWANSISKDYDGEYEKSKIKRCPLPTLPRLCVSRGHPLKTIGRLLRLFSDICDQFHRWYFDIICIVSTWKISR